MGEVDTDSAASTPLLPRQWTKSSCATPNTHSCENKRIIEKLFIAAERTEAEQRRIIQQQQARLDLLKSQQKAHVHQPPKDTSRQRSVHFDGARREQSQTTNPIRPTGPSRQQLSSIDGASNRQINPTNRSKSWNWSSGVVVRVCDPKNIRPATTSRRVTESKPSQPHQIKRSWSAPLPLSIYPPGHPGRRKIPQRRPPILAAPSALLTTSTNLTAKQRIYQQQS